MTGSMYASIAGLKAHMQKLSVIGNNVANVNTQGYKTQRTVFRDSMYRYYQTGANGTETTGGMNPSQLGYGSIIGSIDIDMSSTSYSPGNAMDCALVGDGFFLVGSKETAATIDPKNTDTFKSLSLTRVGDFYFDDDGYLVDGGGNVVYGFMNVNSTGGTDPEAPGNGYRIGPDGKRIPNISDQLVPIRKPRWEKLEDGSYVIRYAVTQSLSANQQGGGGATTTDTEIALKDQKKPASAYAGGTGGNTGGTTDPEDDNTIEDLDYAEFSSISIAANGAITGVCREGDQVITIGYLAMGSVDNPNGVSHTGSSYYRCMDGAGDLRITMFDGVNKDLGVSYVNSYMLDKDATTGAIDTSTAPRGSEIVSAGATSLMTGFLEAPNVDLATEISELITTQRGYQANTRIITVTDSMLEELVNMKR